MAYIKISDPSIIDVSAWHQVINVVNQHSETIDALSNNFGTVANPAWDSSSNFTHRFEPGGQQILFGRSKIVDTDGNTNGTLWYNTVNFGDTTGINSFSATPVVTATVWSGNTGNAVVTTNDDITITVYNVASDKFSYRLARTNSTKAISGTIYVNWMAIGPA